MTLRIAGTLAALALLAACSGEHAGTTGVTPPPCSTAAASPVTLGVGAYALLDPASDSGCVTFATNASASDSAEYLLIAQAAGGPPGDSAAFQLRSGSLAAGTAPARFQVAAARLPAGAALRSRAPIPVAFDHFLREVGRNQAELRALPTTPHTLATRRIVAAVAPPTLGSLRTFTVCAALDCSVFKSVTARVRAVGAHVALYVDTLAPAGGLDSAAIDTLAQTFDTHVYVVDTVAFGGLSDVDSNGVVITLMTPVVNSLVTAAQCNAGGYVAGFTFPGDLDPSARGQYNDGEIFYTIVADPGGTLSCSHTAGEVEATLPGTFLHELQHVISFNQHVLLRGGPQEDLWLDEALSSFAEELGGRSYLPDQGAFSNLVVPDLYNASLYLTAPDDYFMLQTGDTVLAEFGAGWLYMRYLVDQFGGALTNKLEQTSLTGTANVAAQTGLPFATTVSRWALALWVSDLPGFTPPAELAYSSWSFRQTFATLHQQDAADFPSAFPLAPAAAPGSGIDLGGFLRGGSGIYVRALQGPGGAGFSLLFSGGGGTGLPAATVAPRLSVIRIR